MIWMWLGCIAGAYFVGSIPFGVIIGRLKGIDILQHGSMNPGATNVSRLLGRKFGILCFFLDMGKGTGSVIGAGLVGDVLGKPILETSGETAITHVEIWLWLAVTVAAILGHMYSIFLRFRGGKGVATGFGATLGMWPLMTGPAIFAVIVWYTALRLTKYVSLASIAAACSLPIIIPVWNLPRSGSLTDAFQSWPLIVATVILAIVISWKHRGNVARIRRGEEPRAGGLSRRGDLLADKTHVPQSNPDNDQ